MKVSEGLEAIMRELIRDSGYPDATVKDLAQAFAYGLAIGSIEFLKREWESREAEAGRDE